MAPDAMAKGLVDDEATARFHDEGYVVLREALDPSELSAEVDDALERGLRGDGEVKQGSGGVEFRVVVMVCERTPVSLPLLDAFADTASKLVGRPVLPGRAKGTRYFGSSGFHAVGTRRSRASASSHTSSPLDAISGALRVIPRSHRHEGAVGARDAVALATNPGDVIVLTST